VQCGAKAEGVQKTCREWIGMGLSQEGTTRPMAKVVVCFVENFFLFLAVKEF